MTTIFRVEYGRGARVVRRRPLLYRLGADAALDRPAHVRAGSALVRCGAELLVIQDDAAFLARIDSATAEAEAIPYPMPEGVRLFDEGRGNKSQKLDLEAAILTPDGQRLVAFGSGSTSRRERILVVDRPTTSPRVRVVEAAPFYAHLRAEHAFSGSELNVEGAAIDGDDVVLFQRGNGASDGDLRAVDATGRVELAPLLRALDGDGPFPSLHDVRAWELGSIEGTRWTFTDGSTRPDGSLGFLACAEASPDAVEDGPVRGVAIGVLDDRTLRAELGLILDEAGAVLLDKAEGLAFDADRSRAFVVTDRDDPAAPSELLELALGSAWTR